ncbi:hypothetical protein ACIGXM_11665 [Kitasatospora sp. NPDC052896]|uniref:hypothetical protein n=1 Tax=Kitasatospora sp. NPDC052896 TaxID=3364061 RepID=UPI0037C741DE
MSTARTRTLATATLVLTLAGTAACGADAKPGAAHPNPGSPTAAAPAGGASPIEVTPAALLRKVSDRTGAAESAVVSETVQTPSGTITSKGSLSWANGVQGTMQTRLPAALTSKLGSSGPADMVYLPDAMYVNMHLSPAMTAQLGGKHWLKYGYADLATYLGTAGDSLQNGFRNADPVAAVRALIASGRVTADGTETVDSTPTTHYSGDLSLDDLSDGAGAADGLTSDQLDALRQQVRSQGITSEHIDVWVDSDDLLVRHSTRTRTKNGELDLTADYSDYGTPVRPSAPPADDTVDFAALMEQAQQSGDN